MKQQGKLPAEQLARARKIKLLVMDCDGVLTDGRLYYSKDGEELKVFHVHDGQGIKQWHEAGFRSAIITGRESDMLRRRSSELGVHYLKQGAKNKTDDFREIIERESVSAAEVAFIADDIGDIDLLDLVGFPVLVADAAIDLGRPDVYRCRKNGGCGAVREVIDILLESKEISGQ